MLADIDPDLKKLIVAAAARLQQQAKTRAIVAVAEWLEAQAPRHSKEVAISLVQLAEKLRTNGIDTEQTNDENY
ncbi:MAG: hypothetical protein H7Z11_20325 [Verrucomicrobia bacterium]|nr:hypothetical protein [Leptolyngbya sp. ES-bin-22]